MPVNVLFVYPNLYTQMGFNHGLASLSACLEEAGHPTRMVNLNENLPPVPTHDDIVDEVRSFGPGIVAFSCLTMQYPEALAIARHLRAALGDATPPLIVGGIHPTMVPEAVMGDGVWDHVGVGECEGALVNLVGRIEAGERPHDERGFLSWRDGARGGEVVHNPVAEFPDLTRIPEPNYALFDTQRIVDAKNGWFGLLTSRGCPYRCTYCLNHRLVDRYRDELERPVSDLGFFRYRPIDLMIREIQGVLERYERIDTFILDDDLFTQNAEHAIAFCAAYRDAGIGVPFVVNSHVKRLDPRVAQALAEAGCKILKLGIEAGSERVRRDVLKRFMTDDDILATVSSGEEVGLHTSGFVMVGLPGETREERWATVELLARSGIGRFRSSIFYPFPGTESHAYSIEGGWLDPERASTLTDFTESSCLDFGPEENLEVEKLATCMPWFVNARLGGATGARYAPVAAEVLALDEAAWRAFEPTVRGRDRALSAAAVEAGELHYAIRYESFLGVRSDWFLAEDAGIEWVTAAAKPVPEGLGVG